MSQFNNDVQHNKAVLRRQRKKRGQSRFEIYLTAVKLLGQMARLEPHLPRAYKYTLGRMLVEWSTQLVYRVDRMVMMRGDKRAVLEEIAATVRTIEAVLMKLVELRALPEVSPVTEAEAALMCEDIETQARALWKKCNEQIQAGTCPGQGSAG